MLDFPSPSSSERYGGSTSAIREGLQRLVEQGLVVSEPQLGFRVVSLSVEDLVDLTVARCEIEGLALRYAVEHGDLAWESEIVAAIYALEHTPLDTTEPVLLEDWVAAAPALPRGAHRRVPEPAASRDRIDAARRCRALSTLVAAGGECNVGP